MCKDWFKLWPKMQMQTKVCLSCTNVQGLVDKSKLLADWTWHARILSTPILQLGITQNKTSIFTAIDRDFR